MQTDSPSEKGQKQKSRKTAKEKHPAKKLMKKVGSKIRQSYGNRTGK